MARARTTAEPPSDLISGSRRFASWQIAMRRLYVAVLDGVYMQEPSGHLAFQPAHPSGLHFGVVAGRVLHVVAAEDVAGNQTIVVTVYEPDPALWDATLRKRVFP